MSFLSSLLNALPGAVAQGLIWGLMAIGVYITFRILDVADLTVDGSLATGGAAAVMLIRAGVNPWLALLCSFLAGMAAGFVTGLFHTKCGIPAILAGILTQLSLYSINLRIMGSKANQAVGVDKYDLLVSQRYVRTVSLDNPLPLLVVFTVVLIAVLYWFFGTEKGCSLRATGANPNMARAQGINTNANVVLGLMVSNGLVALSGGLLAQFQGSSDINMGRGAIVIGLAAVIILVSYAEGQNRQMREYYESLGNNVVNINAYSPSGRDLTKTIRDYCMEDLDDYILGLTPTVDYYDQTILKYGAKSMDSYNSNWDESPQLVMGNQDRKSVV